MTCKNQQKWPPEANNTPATVLPSAFFLHSHAFDRFTLNTTRFSEHP